MHKFYYNNYIDEEKLCKICVNYKTKYKDIAEKDNEILFFPMPEYSFFKRNGENISVTSQISGKKMTLDKKSPVYLLVSNIFSEKREKTS
jgi:hypothetical protein